MKLLSSLYQARKRKTRCVLSYCLGAICIVSLIYQCMWFYEVSDSWKLYMRMGTECSLWEIDTIQKDMQVFPVRKDSTRREKYAFENGYGGIRTYGGKRKHQGIDIMTSNNKPGYFQIQSATDGVVEQIGWLRLGGYRIGIRSDTGFYYYYAHMDEYASRIKKGMHVKAGDLLGTMGNTGYGKEGTKGKFDVHLHFGIYRQKEGKETSLNPFYILERLK